KGALIAVQNEGLFPLMDGGFRINSRFTPQRLIELGKLDGAIILSHNLKRIEYANVLLTPSSNTRSEETGTRHKAAERAAKQAETLVIAISERRNEITLFYKNKKHILKNTEEIFNKVNKYLQIIEKQRDLFDKTIEELNTSEILLSPNLNLAIQIIQKGRLIQRMAEEIKQPLIELGKDGNILRSHLREQVLGVEKETNLVIKDYTAKSLKKSRQLLQELSYDELSEKEKVLGALSYNENPKDLKIKGWRLLSKTCLTDIEIAKVAKDIGDINKLLYNESVNFEKSLGKDRAKDLEKDLKKIKENY
ncbi:MAG: DNA integrity scanning diadenylate cyclase DisA, partial [Candidatus Nanoarchaeia archaeon]